MSERRIIKWHLRVVRCRMIVSEADSVICAPDVGPTEVASTVVLPCNSGLTFSHVVNRPSYFQWSACTYFFPLFPRRCHQPHFPCCARSRTFSEPAICLRVSTEVYARLPTLAICTLAYTQPGSCKLDRFHLIQCIRPRVDSWLLTIRQDLA